MDELLRNAQIALELGSDATLFDVYAATLRNVYGDTENMSDKIRTWISCPNSVADIEAHLEWINKNNPMPDPVVRLVRKGYARAM